MTVHLCLEPCFLFRTEADRWHALPWWTETVWAIFCRGDMRAAGGLKT